MKLLVLAYAISPYRGSEYSVGWNYIMNMSKDNEIVVLYGASGDHMGDINEVLNYVESNPIPNVTFLPITPNKLTFFFNILNKKGIFVYSFYFAYHLWHKQVFKVAEELVKSDNFDLIHYLNPIGYREPGYLWKLGLPYIWGPIGGTSSVSLVLMKALPILGKIKLGFRKIINYFQLRLNLNLYKAIKNTDVLIAATTFDQNNFKRIYNTNVLYMPENGITQIINKKLECERKSKVLNLIWVGSVDERKALIILLKAFLKIKNKDKIHIHIVGDGPLKNSLEGYANKNNINDYITWYGKLERKKVIEVFALSHLHIITSVGEGNPTTIWEAMSFGVPTLSLDHCGMHDTICEKCGIKIPIKSYTQVINDIALYIEDLCLNPDKLKKMSEGVLECSSKYTWDKRISFFNELYELAIKNWNAKQK